MSELAIAVAVLGAAALLSLVLPPRLWPVLATVVIVVPLALSVPGAVRDERERAQEASHLTPLERDVEPPIYKPRFRKVRLLATTRKLVPSNATLTVLPGGRYLETKTRDEARAAYMQTGWVRWAAFVLAPRLIVTETSADWVLLLDQTPREAGLEPSASWRFGRDWLVRQ
jgi:hypothetical protein